MKKRIKKHIEKEEFVKLFIVDHDGSELINFNGFLFAQNDTYVVMNDLHDFNFDGFVLVKKADISEIKRTDNEVFFEKILRAEGLKNMIFENFRDLNFQLDSLPEMLERLRSANTPIIIEGLHHGKDTFQIGPINKIEKKRVYLDYFNSRGEFDFKPVSSKFKDITYIRMKSPYAEMFFKYSRRIE